MCNPSNNPITKAVAPIVTTVKNFANDAKQVLTNPGKANLGQFATVASGGLAPTTLAPALADRNNPGAYVGYSADVTALGLGISKLAPAAVQGGAPMSTAAAAPSVAATSPAGGSYASAFSDAGNFGVLPPSGALDLTGAEADSALGVPTDAAIAAGASAAGGSGGSLLQNLLLGKALLGGGSSPGAAGAPGGPAGGLTTILNGLGLGGPSDGTTIAGSGGGPVSILRNAASSSMLIPLAIILLLGYLIVKRGRLA